MQKNDNATVSFQKHKATKINGIGEEFRCIGKSDFYVTVPLIE